MIEDAREQIKNAYPKFSEWGYRHLISKDKKEIYLIRGKIGDKTVRFAYGTDFPIVTKIGSAERKHLGKKYGKKFSKSKTTKARSKSTNPRTCG